VHGYRGADKADKIARHPWGEGEAEAEGEGGLPAAKSPRENGRESTCGEIYARTRRVGHC